MFFSLYDLYNEISKYRVFYVYGMGEYAGIIVPKLFNLGLRERMAGYVVSKKEVTADNKEGIRIYCIDELPADVEDSVFLVAVSEKFEREIENKLDIYGYKNRIRLSFYEGSDQNAYFRFKDTDLERYMGRIAEWYEYKNANSVINDVQEFHKEMYNRVIDRFEENDCRRTIQNRNQIVFIVLDQQPRIQKIIGSLINRNYEIVIVYLKQHKKYPYIKYEEKTNITTILCDSIEEILFEAVQFNPLLFYVRPAWLDSSIANILFMQKDYFGKIVLDIHDIATGCYNLPDTQKWWYEIERKALEEADGIVWRYDAEDFLAERYNFSYKGKTIHMWDYCYDEFTFQEANRGDVLRLCCIDSNAECLMPVNDDELCRDGIMRYANINDILKKIGHRDDCIFILYISRVTEKELSILSRIKREYVNFEYYIGYSPQKLIQSMAQCDYGCDIFSFGRLPSDQECAEKNYERLAGTYTVSATNRFFDYLNAGIPIIGNGHKKLCDYLESLGVLLNIDLEQLDVEYLKAKREFYKEHVKKSQVKLSINSQIGRLIEFFYSVS